jgi:hypothetical protein
VVAGEGLGVGGTSPGGTTGAAAGGAVVEGDGGTAGAAGVEGCDEPKMAVSRPKISANSSTVPTTTSSNLPNGRFFRLMSRQR